MSYTFNLIDEPWIPCLYENETVTKEVSLKDVFRDSQEILEISDPSPVITAALHRLLLAVLHRNFGPQNMEEWGNLFNNGRWNMGRLEEYFEKWHHRFDLFDTIYPFYQVAGLPVDKATTIARITHEYSVGNNPTFFDHNYDSSPPHFTPAQSARYLVGIQAFSLAGLISYEANKPQNKNSKQGPLANAAVILACGKNLFQTLMFNLLRLDGPSGEPFDFDHKSDIPAWERDKPTGPDERYPDGYIDLLTWQSRRILLTPTLAEGVTEVCNVVYMKGFFFPSNFTLFDRETMVAYRTLAQPRQGQTPWTPVVFQPERSLWRDSLPIFQRLEGRYQRPKSLEWLADLVLNNYIDEQTGIGLIALGLRTANFSSMVMWRYERMPLPLPYLTNDLLVGLLTDAITTCESVAIGLRMNIKDAIKELLPEGSAAPRGGPGTDQVSLVYKSLGAESKYWSDLDIAFRLLLQKLSDCYDIDLGVSALRSWAIDVRTSATAAMQSAVDTLESSTKAMKATALALSGFNAMLERYTRSYLADPETEEAIN